MPYALAAALTCLLALSSPAWALDPSTPAASFALASWTQKDGLSPGTIYAIAQDRRGYLWLGTSGGLVRFDGARFVRWGAVRGAAFPYVAVGALVAAPDGSIWVGFRGVGGVSRVRDDSVTVYGPEEGLPAGAVTSLLVDRHGTVWAGSLRGLSRLRGDRWDSWDESHGLPTGRVHAIHEDRHGELWVAASAGVFRSSGADVFRQVSPDTTVRTFAEDAAGTLLGATGTGLLVRLLGSGGPATPLHVGGVAASAGEPQMLRDRDDNLWIAEPRGGVVRVSPQMRASRSLSSAERLTAADGLRSDRVLSLFEDREGNLWFGTDRGLNRLSNSIISTVRGPGDASIGTRLRSILSTDTEVWVGTEDGLYAFEGGRPDRWAPVRARGLMVSSLYRDKAGVLWVGSNQGFWRMEGSRLEPLPVPGVRGYAIRAFLTDASGTLWFSDAVRGTFRWTPGEPSITVLTATIGISMLEDSRGAVWIGFNDGTVSRYAPGGVESFSPEQGLVGDRAAALHEDRQGRIWVATNGGLSRFDGTRFVTLTTEHGVPVDNITSMAEDQDGYLWLGAGTGIVRLKTDEFDKVARNPAYRPNFDVYGTNDGLPGTPRAVGYPAAARAVDGTLWFLTSDGLASVQPHSVRDNAAAAVVVIEGASSGSQAVSFVPGARLPARTTNLQINYTALSFTAPAQIHFRYRLRGLDDGWIDAGTRRQAFFTNLPPRGYDFDVMATANGVWPAAPVTWHFSIAPAFYQTQWFQGLCVAVIALLLYGAWQVRALQMRRRFALILNERTRISRELHDTLLQSLVGVGMQFDALRDKVESLPAARAHVERLAQQVKFHIGEARQSVWDLRSPMLESGDLRTVLEEVGRRVADDHHIPFDFLVRGTPRPCTSRRSEEQLLRISQEALANAVRHANAAHVRMELHYDDHAITLRVVDDGRGFDVNATASTGRHCGLVSMRERAQQVGAKLRVISRPGAGTTVEVVAA